MKTLRVLAVLTIFLIGLMAALYPQRAAILDWYQEATKPELPAAVTYEEVQEEEVVVEEVAQVEIEEVVQEEEEEVDEVIELEEEAPEVDLEEDVIEPEEEEVELPDSINLAVPFTSQAPHANWDYPYKEACEEASVYMIERYYADEPEGQISADKADAGLLQIVAFEEELFGYYEDTTAEQTGVFAELMFGFAAVQIIEDPTVEQIKHQLASGRPVIVPAAGRLLGNPNFTAPGPIYHMLVIRGYTSDDQFITNDPGTRNGEAYLYDFDTIMYAMHDWNGGDEITEGRKVIIIIYP